LKQKEEVKRSEKINPFFRLNASTGRERIQFCVFLLRSETFFLQKYLDNWRRIPRNGSSMGNENCHQSALKRNF
jgi:hypothetical protein